MTYAGTARTKAEQEAALAIAAATFISGSNASVGAIQQKKSVLGKHPGFSDRSPVVVVSDEGQVVASAFIVESYMFLEGGYRKCAFISSVSVTEVERGKGRSLVLMEAALKAAIDSGFHVAVVIARRAVDRFYLKFGFWGVSQYSKVSLPADSLRKEKDPTAPVSVKPVTLNDLSKCHRLYSLNYGALLGHCKRDSAIWHYLLHKVKHLGLQIDLVSCGNTEVGYVVHDGRGHIHEIAPAIQEPALNAHTFVGSIAPRDDNTYTLEIPPSHPFLPMLEEADLSLTLRECRFGGHMVRVLSPFYAACDQSQEICKSVRKTDLTLAETVAELGISRVTDLNPRPFDVRAGSFNIPLLDQI